MSATAQATASQDFTHRYVPTFGKRVHRLGLAGNYGIDEAGLSAALERGLNYIFWTPRQGRLTRVLREALKRDRERFVLAAGPTFGWFPGQVRRGAERALKVLGTDYLDLYQLYWLSRMSAWTEGTVEELLKLKQEGKVRALGVSIHDRPRAGRLAEDSPLDVLMIRYNAAHPGAERDIFPHLAEAQAGPRGLHRHGLAPPAQAPPGLGRPGAHRGRLLPLLPLQPPRGRGAQRPREPRAARREPRRAGAGPPLLRGAGVDAALRPGRPRLRRRGRAAQATAGFPAGARCTLMLCVPVTPRYVSTLPLPPGSKVMTCEREPSFASMVSLLPLAVYVACEAREPLRVTSALPSSSNFSVSERSPL